MPSPPAHTAAACRCCLMRMLPAPLALPCSLSIPPPVSPTFAPPPSLAFVPISSEHQGGLSPSSFRMLFHRLCYLAACLPSLFLGILAAEELNPLKLLRKDLESLNCLFFRRNCTNHLADLASANRLFWKVSRFRGFGGSPAFFPRLAAFSTRNLSSQW